MKLRGRKQEDQRGAWTLWRVMPRALPYLKPYWKLGAFSFLLMVVASLAALAQPWPFALMLDIAASGQRGPASLFLFGESDLMTALGIATVAGFLIIVVAHGLTVVNSYFDSKLEQNMILDLRSDLFEHAQQLSLAFHDERQTGELMARINYAASALGAIFIAFLPLIQAFLTLVGMAVIAALIDWQVTLISMSVLPFLYYSLSLYGARIVPRLEHVQKLEWRSLSIVNESMGMLRVIVPFGRERYEHRKFREQGQTAVDARIALTVRETLFTLAVTTCTALGTALVFYFGFKAYFSGRIQTGELVVLLSYIAAVYAPLEQISSTIGHMNQQLVQLNASFQLLDLEPEVKEAPDAIGLGRARGEVKFDRVTFAYKRRSAVLRDVSLDVPAGSRVAIVGPTGAGKTTLVGLLVRFYDPQHGRVLIDGIDIRQLELHSLRSQISVVLQEPLLFAGSVASNIQYGHLEAGMDEVLAAAKAANAHDFIVNLPHGYETVVGERGAGLSGGERQRIAVARAFLKDAPILVLDEPTSSIDSKTEEVVLDALDRLALGRTSFMIAHRLSTIRDADIIVVIQAGRIVEQGSHEELLRNGGLYHQLHEAQVNARRRRPDAALAVTSGSDA
jgi:ABC-type multidrug transport system fused ATPase/permease subunit